MDLNELLQKLKDTYQSSVNDVNVNQLSESNSQALAFKKQQELKGLPQSDIQSVLNNIKNDNDQYNQSTGMAAMSGGIGTPRFSGLLGRNVEEGLSKLRETPMGESSIGQFIENNVRQPLKRAINGEDFGKMGQETENYAKNMQTEREAANNAFDKYNNQPEVQKTQNDAYDIYNANKNYDAGDIVNPEEATQLIKKRKG